MATVLVVEDELNISQMLQEIFKMEGFDVEAAFDGDQGIEKARFGMPDIIILDIGLPNKSGWEVIQYLKGEEQTKAIPVIILSALSQKEDIDRGLKLGASRYLTKPCDPFQVVATIKEVLRI